MNDPILIDNLIDYTNLLQNIENYTKMIFYGIVILIVLNVIKGA